MLEESPANTDGNAMLILMIAAREQAWDALPWK
jgi:hypothetical protein